MLFQIPKEMYDPLKQMIAVTSEYADSINSLYVRNAGQFITLRVAYDAQGVIKWSFVSRVKSVCHALITDTGNLFLLTLITDLSEFKKSLREFRVKDINAYMKQAPLANVGVGSNN